VLRAWAWAGDAVFVPAFTFAATAEVAALAVLSRCCDVLPDTFNMDPASWRCHRLVSGWETHAQGGKRVDLFASPLITGPLGPLRAGGIEALLRHRPGLWRTFGWQTRRACDAAATSFFPAKRWMLWRCARASER